MSKKTTSKTATAKKTSSKKATKGKAAKKDKKGDGEVKVRGYYAGTTISATPEVLKENPCREGSKRAADTDLIRKAGKRGIKYEDYVAAGGNRFNLNDGYVRGYFEVKDAK